MSSKTVAPPETKYLGRGTFGYVEQVTNRSGLYEARKVFKLQGPDCKFRKSCQVEFAMLKLARDQKAPNVLWAAAHIQEPEFRNQEGLALFNMELGDLGNLHQFVHNTPRLYVGEHFVKWVALQSLTGLDWLHARHVLHGDLKTTNLLVFNGPFPPHIKIGDLGTCVELDQQGVDSTRQIRKCITTYEYAAPEMLIAGPTTNPITLGADVYSLGVLLMEIAGHQHPCYNRSPTPSADSHEEQMLNKYCHRPRTLAVYKQRYSMSKEMLAFLLRATIFYAEHRPSVSNLQRDGLLDEVRAGYHYEFLWSPLARLKLKAKKAALTLQVKDLEARLTASQTRPMSHEMATSPPQVEQHIELPLLEADPILSHQSPIPSPDPPTDKRARFEIRNWLIEDRLPTRIEEPNAVIVAEVLDVPPPIEALPDVVPLPAEEEDMVAAGNWDSVDYRVPPNAQATFEERFRANNLHLDAPTRIALYNLSLDVRMLYSQHYVNGNVFPLKPDRFCTLLPDPKKLNQIPKLQMPKGVPYNDFEKGFLLACWEICESSLPVRILGLLVLKNRTKESIKSWLARLI